MVQAGDRNGRPAWLWRAASAAALAACASSAAAAPDANSSTASTVQEITVTGTRLPKADLTADSPIVTVTREDVQSSGILTLETLLNRLPQVVPNSSSAANNPSANGASYVNLRGLGVSRNLVLLDGRRVVGANATNTVDLNTIPPALIERVEVITGGASAVYGADAVAGVVNVILKTRFDGLEVQGRTLESQRGDGREYDVSAAAGRRFERGGVMASFGWSRRDEIGKGARPFSSQAESASSFLPSGAYVPGLNTPTQAAVNTVFARYGAAPGAVSTRGGIGGFSFNGDGTLFAPGNQNSPFDVQNYRGSLDDAVTRLYPDVFAYNYQPFNKLILPLERWSGAVFADAQVSDRVSLFGQVMATRYTAETSLAPTPAPTDPNPLYPGAQIPNFTIPVTNPFIPADLAQLLASRTRDAPGLPGAGPTEDIQYKFRAVQLGPRRSSNVSNVVNALGGVKLDLGHDWRGEAYASFGRYRREETLDGQLAVRRFEQLMYSPTGGTEFCASGFNPFGGKLSAACRDFLDVRLHALTDVEQRNAVASASGPLFHLPDGPVLAAVGAEYRYVRIQFTPPAGVGPGEVAGFTSHTSLGGSVRFADLFAEVSAPLLADRLFAHALDLTLGYRRSDERTTGAVDSYKAELGWSPVPQLKVRAAAQRAVRAPDIFERYEPGNAFPLTGHDPCAADNPQRTAQVLALCRKQATALGFKTADTDAFVQGGDQISALLSGNADVQPERATTLTLGLVWRPGWASPWLGDLAATVDGYDIRVHGAIGYQDPQLTLNACYNLAGASNPAYDPANAACQTLHRSTADFSLFNVDAPETNQAELMTSGVDFSLAFRTDLAELSGRAWLGRLDTNLAIGWLAHLEEQPSPAQPRIDYAGTIAGSIPGYESLPRWKGQGTFTWSTGPVALGLAGRFTDAMQTRDRRNGLPDPGVGAGSAWYWDLSGRWAVGVHAQFRAGVLNLFDHGPELYRPSVDAGTDPSTYDVIGRRFWLGLMLRL